AVGKEHLVDRREELDRGLQVDEVVPAAWQRLDAEIALADAVEIERGRRDDLAALRPQLAMQVDHEVEEIQPEPASGSLGHLRRIRHIHANSGEAPEIAST